MDRNSKKPQLNLWENFLSEAALGDSYRDSHVLLLGPRNTGKRSLINSIFQNIIGDNKNNNKMGTKGHTSALEYTYIMVKNPEDPENDDYISKMNIWVLDDPAMHDLLSHCIREDTVENMVICLCLDMAEPWNSLNTLSEWTNIVSEKVTRILRDMPLYKQDKLRDRLAKYVKTYEQPKFDEEKKLIKPKLSADNLDEEQIDIPLPDGVLKINYGIPIIVLGTKADALETLEKDKEGEYKLDFLQQQLRTFGLPYAATLLYISLKQNINLDIFYDYLLHRLYNFGLKYSADAVHKDSIFIPSGYDKPKMINETFQHIKQGDIFEEVISQPASKKAANKEEVVTKDTQSFLAEIKLKEPAAANSSGNVDDPRTSVGSQPKPANASSKDFFKNLIDKDGNSGKPGVEGPPSHSRNTSQVSSTTARTEAPTSSVPDVNPRSTTSTTSTSSRSRAERLMDLLKK